MVSFDLLHQHTAGRTDDDHRCPRASILCHMSNKNALFIVENILRTVYSIWRLPIRSTFISVLLLIVKNLPFSAVILPPCCQQPTTNMQATADPICCLAASEKALVIGRESGSLQRYSLPQVALTNRYTLNCRPHKLAINCNTT